MESSSKIHTSAPSFNQHSSNNIAYRIIDDDDGVFIFSDNPTEISDVANTNTHTETVNQTEEDADQDEDEREFEFPVICGDFNSCDEVVSDDQITLRYPLFDRTLLSDLDLNLCNDVVAALKTDSRSKPSPATRSSLMKLFTEDRDSVSTSSSEAETDDLDGITAGTYCVWKPKAETPRGKHKKSNSISTGNTSSRWKVRDLLKRSYSDDNYSSGKDSPVLLFIPPISPNRKGKVDSTVSSMSEKRSPAYKTKIGNIRLPPYLPYREDQIAAFANFSGGKKDLYRY